MTQLVQVNVQVIGFKNRQFTWGLKNAAHRGAVLAATVFQDKLISLISIPVGRGGSTTGLAGILGIRVGRGRKNYRTRHTVIRSRPGEPPRKETGELIRSIKLHKSKRDLTYTIYTDSVYARALEFGYAPRNLLPRPHWLVAFASTWRTMQRLIEIHINFYISTYVP